MKKLIAFITALIMVCLLSACGAEDVTSVADKGSVVESSETVQPQQTPTASKNDTAEKKNTATASKTHKHKYTAVKTAATCKQQGYTTYTCSCGDTYTDDYVDGACEFENNKCKYCGKADLDGLYANLKAWVLKNGTVNGDYVYYSKSSDVYGGYANENFSLCYWNDTEKLEFCLHSPLNDTYSHNFYIYIPKKQNGKFDYISSYYYRDTGESKYESKGVIEAAEFTSNYPLKSTDYYGSAERQNSFLEESRVGICDLLNCMKKFLTQENTGYTLSDVGFANF